MKIKRIEIKNWVGVSEFALDPGKINVFSGHKGSGKTSIIEGLEKTFTNKNRRTEVIKHGENEATLYIQTDTGLEIERRIRSDRGDYLKIRKPGEAVPQTEAFLRKLINGEIFRPLEFIKQSPEVQAKIILNMLEIPWTMDDIQKWFNEIPSGVNYEAHILQVLKQIEKLYYDQRESVNREIKVLEAQVTGIRNELPPNYDGDYWREQKVQEYYGKVAEAEEINKKIATARTLINGLENRIAAIMAEAEADKQAKRNHFDRQRNDIREFKQFLSHKIEKNQESIQQVDQKIQQAEEALDLELQRKIQALKEEYSFKKEQSRRNIKAEAESLEQQIAEWQKSMAAKEQELTSIDQLEEQSLKAIDERVQQQIETENAKVGNAKTILETTKEIDVEPLRRQADEVAHMQSYLREFDRMTDIIKTKLAPRQELSQTLTAKIAKARELPMELLKIAAVPIPGVTVDGDGRIRIGQTLISDLSEGEQLELAFRVAKAQCGPLKVICLDGINKINESDRAMIEAEMQSDEYQYFVTTTVDGDLQVEIKEAV
ncbi:MAG: AAA family ATPase [Bacillota bacterium]